MNLTVPVPAAADDARREVEARLDALVLAHLHSKEKPSGPAALRDATWRFAPATATKTSWKELIEASILRLKKDNAISSKRVVLDGAGVWKRLGLTKPRAWSVLVGATLPARALGVELEGDKPPGWLVDGDRLAAAIVARVLELSPKGRDPLSPPQLGDAVIWRRLGLKGKAKSVPSEIRSLYLARELDIDSGDYVSMLLAFAARALGVELKKSDKLAPLRNALVRRWLTNAGALPVRSPSSIPAHEALIVPTQPKGPDPLVLTSPASTAKLDLAAFAKAVQAAADAEKSAVFGTRKVFIVAVWQALRGQPATAGLDLPGFKRRLTEAHHRGLLVLARADLVGHMDPVLVDGSETIHLEATYHFVTRKEPS